LLILTPASYQTAVKNWIVSVCIYQLIPLTLFSQVSDQEILLLQKLDSIQQTSSPAKHFASLYLKTTGVAAEFFQHDKPEVKQFILRLESRFAGYFFRSVEAFHMGHTIPMEWQAYFSDTVLSPLQYQLLGINAHINGDIWQALTTEFTLEEILENKKSYFDFQKGLIKIYRNFYESSVDTHAAIRLLRNSSFGLDKLYGKMMLAKWRKRQMDLAVLYHTDPSLFQKKLDRLHKKMDRLNQLILHHL